MNWGSERDFSTSKILFSDLDDILRKLICAILFQDKAFTLSQKRGKYSYMEMILKWDFKIHLKSWSWLVFSRGSGCTLALHVYDLYEGAQPGTAYVDCIAAGRGSKEEARRLQQKSSAILSFYDRACFPRRCPLIWAITPCSAACSFRQLSHFTDDNSPMQLS